MIEDLLREESNSSISDLYLPSQASRTSNLEVSEWPSEDRIMTPTALKV